MRRLLSPVHLDRRHRPPVHVVVAVQLGERPELRPEVALRPERFGALAYHFGNRKLSFLKHPDLVRVVEALDGSVTVEEALRTVGVAESRWPSFLAALSTLEASEMLHVPEGGRAA